MQIKMNKFGKFYVPAWSSNAALFRAWEGMDVVEPPLSPDLVLRDMDISYSL